MLKQFYSNNRFNELAQNILKTGNIDALFELNSIIADLNYNNQKLNNIDTLSLYYIYCIWMPEGLRKDFNILYQYIINDLSNILLPLISQENHYLKNNTDITDKYNNILIDIANKIIYKYTNGICGLDLKNKFIYFYLTEIFKQDYSYISDDVLKLLFFGSMIYKTELFVSKAEFDIFFTFLINKNSIIFMGYKDNQYNIENSLNEIKLI